MSEVIVSWGLQTETPSPATLEFEERFHVGILWIGFLFLVFLPCYYGTYADIAEGYTYKTRKWPRESYAIRRPNIVEKSGHPKYKDKRIIYVTVYLNKEMKEVVKWHLEHPDEMSLGFMPYEFSIAIDPTSKKVLLEQWPGRDEFIHLHPEYDIPPQPKLK